MTLITRPQKYRSDLDELIASYNEQDIDGTNENSTAPKQIFEADIIRNKLF